MIECRALRDQSLFVTSKGDILPCCFIYQGGPNLTNLLKTISKDPTYKLLVDSWNTSDPYYKCNKSCNNDNIKNPDHLIHYDNQWKNNNN